MIVLVAVAVFTIVPWAVDKVLGVVDPETPEGHYSPEQQPTNKGD